MEIPEDKDDPRHNLSERRLRLGKEVLLIPVINTISHILSTDSHSGVFPETTG
jgi:hypothetical protein